jgi:asparagine synthase (glutamine-hydrolysing)
MKKEKKKKEKIRLREALQEAVKRNLGDGILLSGGLDSSILAVLASEVNPKLKAFTVGLQDFGSDRDYAERVCQFLNISHYQRQVSINEAMALIPEVIKIIASFDPALPNDLATYLALKLAKEHGAESVITGDGGDELFAGYEYMERLNLVDYLPKLAQNLSFSSSTLGKALGLEVKQPYLDEEFKCFAMTLEPDLKIKKENGKHWGKWILRKAFEEELPSEIIWRKKIPVETGSGFAKLRQVIPKRVSDKEFKEAQAQNSIKFRNKEHFFYYKIYREVVGKIPSPKKGEKKCLGCGAGLPLNRSHCRTCGAYPG